MACRLPLFRTHTLPAGLRVRLRFPHRGDVAGLVALHERIGRPLSEFEAGRRVHFAPAREIVLCATAWVQGVETLVGCAGAPLDGGELWVVADEATAPGVGDALGAALRLRLAVLAQAL